MTGAQIMVVLIVAIVMFASMVKAKHHSSRRRGMESGSDAIENHRLQEEVKTLKERVAVLERIATDKNHLLEQEFEKLRDS
jgi:cell division protein FtsL